MQITIINKYMYRFCKCKLWHLRDYKTGRNVSQLLVISLKYKNKVTVKKFPFMNSLLLRRFVFRMANEWLVMNRKGPWEGYRRLARCLLPAFLCAHAWKRDVWVRGRFMKVQNNVMLISILGGDFIGGERVWWRDDQISMVNRNIKFVNTQSKWWSRGR